MLHYKCFIKKGHTCLGVAFFIMQLLEFPFCFLVGSGGSSSAGLYKCMPHGEGAFVGILSGVTGSEPAGDRSSGVFEKVTELALIKDIR